MKQQPEGESDVQNNNSGEQKSKAARRPWWKKKRCWLGYLPLGLIAILLVCIYTIPRFPFGPYTLYGNLTDEQRTAIIPYETLTNEETHPFYVRYERITNNPQLKKAIRKYPHVRDCLVRSQADKQTPNLRLIDWHRLSGYTEGQVCLWRIFTSLESPERVKDWMSFHGYETSSTELFERKTLSGRRKWVDDVPKSPVYGIFYIIYRYHPLSISESISAQWVSNIIKTVEFKQNISN